MSKLINVDEKIAFFKALGEENRLKIITHLLDLKGCICICKLSDVIGKDQSVVFRHVKVLKEAGILNTKKEGSFLMCCIKDRKMIEKILEV